MVVHVRALHDLDMIKRLLYLSIPTTLVPLSRQHVTVCSAELHCSQSMLFFFHLFKLVELWNLVAGGFFVCLLFLL